MGVSKISKEEKLEWVEANKSLNVKEVAKKFNRDHKTIRTYFKQSGYKPVVHVKDRFCRELFNSCVFKFKNQWNYSIKDFSKDFGYSVPGLRALLKKEGVSFKGHSYKNKPVNHNFFRVIDSEIKAYLLGFFAADGHIEKRKDYDMYTLKINIHRKDVEVLQLFNTFVANDLCNISYPKTKPTMCCINITSKQIGVDLLKLGYDNRKTYTNDSIPNIPENMVRHFIRGYFDGDGSIMINKRGDGVNVVFNISSYKETILNEIFSKFNLVGGKIYTEKTGKVSRMVCGKMANFRGACTKQVKDKVNILSIYKYMYEDANYFLTRKYEKFLEIENHFNKASLSKVAVVDIETGATYSSIKEASDSIGINYSTLRSYLNGKNTTVNVSSIRLA